MANFIRVSRDVWVREDEIVQIEIGKIIMFLLLLMKGGLIYVTIMHGLFWLMSEDIKGMIYERQA